MTTTTPPELPPVGSTVTWGKTRYRVEAHGCATWMARCKFAPYSLTVLELDRHGLPKWQMTQCIPGDQVIREEVK